MKKNLIISLIIISICPGIFAQVVTLYEDASFKGNYKNINTNWNASDDYYFNDRISSIAVPPGIKIIVFSEANFTGDFMELTGNWSINSTQDFWNNRISSIIYLDYNRKPGPSGPPAVRGRSCLDLGDHHCPEAAIFPDMQPGNGYFVSLNAAIKNPSEVRILDIRGQNLSEWPAFFNQLTNLEELYISNNQFKSWPPFFHQLSKLRVLVADHNNFTGYPDFFHQFTHLQVLNIAGNPISTFPSFFHQMTALIELDISYTDITSFPSFFSQLERLHYLDMRNTKIQNIPMEVHQMNMIIVR